MLSMVPIFMSFTGWFTVTRPFLVGCLNCLCEPDCATSTQQSSASFLITSRLLIGIGAPSVVCIIYTQWRDCSRERHRRFCKTAHFDEMVRSAWRASGRGGGSGRLKMLTGD